jgi:hypothetical protein
MRLLPTREAWARWDWATRFGVITGVASIALSVVATVLWLFGFDLWQSARSWVQALNAPDPWEAADEARAEALEPEVRREGNRILALVNDADLRAALRYQQEYGDAQCYEDSIFRALMKTRFAMAMFLHPNDYYRKFPEFEGFLDNERPSKLLALYKLAASGTSPIRIRDDVDVKRFAAELLAQYDRVVATPDWEAKFERFVKAPMDYEAWLEETQGRLVAEGTDPSDAFLEVFNVPFRPFVDAGFPPNPDYCMNNSGYGLGLNAYMYSFWWRRWREGTMLATQVALQVVARLRILPVPAPPPD